MASRIQDVEARGGEVLRIARFFTRPGADPYDEVEWEIRDARIGTGDKVAFEQTGVEFPRDWSQNATNIVAQKYFRGGLGTPERERSVKQMIGRVVGWYSAKGTADRYFAPATHEETFRAELTHLLLMQKMAFNSPVWFNVGLVEPPRVSACQPYDALVYTPSGPVPIGRLVETNAVGEKVFDAQGITKVLAVKSNGTKRVLRVDVGSHQLDVTADHLVWRASSSSGEGRFVPAGDLRVGDRLVWVRSKSEGEGTFELRDVAEAGLAGWLQSDGFVGRYSGTNKSWTFEFQTVTDAEFNWVSSMLDQVFPDIHRKVTSVQVQDERLKYRRIRLYGRALRPFIERWGLMRRGVDAVVPPALLSAPLPVVRAYLRSIFQAEGHVAWKPVNGSGVPHNGSLVGAATISPQLMAGVKLLLERFGIFSRLREKIDKRPDRHNTWVLAIGILGDQVRFAHEIGFIDPRKQSLLEASFDRNSHRDKDFKTPSIRSIEDLGEMDVYDIQTESGEYLSNGIRVHNCFILDVEDDMRSILNWYVEEGLIFKAGSGSGINLSKLRSSKERLSSGGTASGPVSFMRGADASAGTIKSGGSTRRAAKMVVLDADHPDVEEFIWCKTKEERKARALREAGFDMDLDGADSHSIQYQNANNSVGLSHEFIQAYLEERDWQLRAVTDRRVIKTLKARDLMRQVAEAAWECADPGLFYLGTMNQWHTSPAEGEIKATNPCGEFVRIANTSCNLASLRLTKFLDAEGNFDVEAFTAAAETTLTAMDISVTNAEYPTDKIRDMVAQYRELGLGYTDLGALLMRQGIAYDSDKGRAWAAAITALMGGVAYRRSAEIAGALGPYPGWHKPGNADAHLKVVRMHRAAVDQIDRALAPAAILEAARAAWDEALQLGERHGYRNAQTTLIAPTGTISFLMDADTTGIEPDLALVKTKKLVGGGVMKIVNQAVPSALKKLGYSPQQISEIVAFISEHNSVKGAPYLDEAHYPIFDCAMGDSPIHYMGHVKMMAAVQPALSGAISKCVTGETLVPSAEGLIRIRSLYWDENPDEFRDHVVEVGSLGGPQKTDAFYYGGPRPVQRITLRSGHRLTGTLNHPVLVAGSGGPEWRELAAIAPGDRVAVQYGTDLWAWVPPWFGDFIASTRYGNQKSVRIPEEMTEDLALLLGAFVAEGHITRSTSSIVITDSVEKVVVKVAELWERLFGVKARIDRRGGCPQVIVSSKEIVEFFTYLGCGDRASRKRIPDAVLRSPRSMVLAFLRGLFLDGLSRAVGGSMSVAICLDSPALLDDLQAVLTNLGVVHGRVTKLNRTNGKSYDEVYAAGPYAKELNRLVPFLEPEKQARADALAARTGGASTLNAWDVVPGITGHELYQLIPRGVGGRNGKKSLRRGWTFLLDARTKEVSRRTVERLAMVPGVELPVWLREVLDNNLHFVPVEKVEDGGEEAVYDISVPTSRAFVANGIVSHNTVNMPESVTVDDIEKVYIEAWRLGLKNLAIYRDNCKVAQPLAAEKKAAPPKEERAKPVRRRLPRKRPAKTMSFRIADCDGYVLAGEYPDTSELGEIFLKVAKQGSTLAGVMDAFAIAISIGLQYGVPLRAYVEKFINMRFEPSGMTDDPDFRFATSIVDYIFRMLAADYLSPEERAELNVMTTEERQRTLNGGVPVRANGKAHDETQVDVAQARPNGIDAPLCYTCGISMQPAGSCFVCGSCGTTSGCS